MIVGILVFTSFQCAVIILSSLILGDMMLSSMIDWICAFLNVPRVDMYSSHAFVSACACLAWALVMFW